MPVDPYWRQQLFEYDASGNPVRIGKHKSENAKQGDEGWYIWTCTFDANSNCTKKLGPTIGKWA